MNKYNTDNKIVENYINAIDFMQDSMNKLKKELENKSNKVNKDILTMTLAVKELYEKYPNSKLDVVKSVVMQIAKCNNGILLVKMIEPLNISRQYLSILQKERKLEKLFRGIYIIPQTIEDSYYIFQVKYNNAVFSHMNALYFFNLTEEFPYKYTVTVPRNYHVKSINEKCNVFYVDEDIYNIGLCFIKDANGNKIKCYDIERNICDIIRSKNRIDSEQVKKTIKNYLKLKNKNLKKLSDYSKQMGIYEQVMNYVELFYD